jgi:hypothetical protein
MTLRRFAVLCAGCLGIVLLWSLAAPTALTGVERARVLRSLGSFDLDTAVSSPATSWDQGWLGLCQGDAAARVYMPSESSARVIAARAAVGVGDFLTLRALVTQPDLRATFPNASAYERALRGDWLGAAEAYDNAGTKDGNTARFWGTILFLAGQRAFDAGDQQTADRLLTEANTLYGKDGPFSSAALAHCLDGWGSPADARRELRRASASLSPIELPGPLSSFVSDANLATSVDWRPSEAARPAYRIAVDVEPDWSVVGVDVDRQDLRQSPLLRVATYWQTPRMPDQVAILHSMVGNLVANGALQWDYAPPGVRPFGYFASVYSDPPSVSVRTDADGRKSLCLTSPPGPAPVNGSSTGVQGLTFRLTPSIAGSTLIQGGDVISREGGYFALGRRWFGGSALNPYSYVAAAPAGAAPTEWKTFVGSEQLEPGVDSVAVWLLHNGQGGATCYTDLFMFELPAPPPL